MVGRYPTNQLIERGPLHRRLLRGFLHYTEAVDVCGISHPFGQLFPTNGHVTHALLSRPPLTVRKRSVRLACFRHAASVYPEPGSNSPSEIDCSAEAEQMFSRILRARPHRGRHAAVLLTTLQLSRCRRAEVTHPADAWLGTGLPSRGLVTPVLSALERFTTVFGMGTGGTTPL